jgi:hypothetical protein
MSCVFWFHLQHFSEYFLILRRIQRDIIINLQWYSCKVTVIPVIFSKKNLKYEFYENLSRGSRGVPCGSTDRHDEANSRLSQFCEGAINIVILQSLDGNTLACMSRFSHLLSVSCLGVVSTKCWPHCHLLVIICKAQHSDRQLKHSQCDCVSHKNH